MESLGFSIYNVASCVSSSHFISLFPIWMFFISLSCLIWISVLERLFSGFGEWFGKKQGWKMGVDLGGCCVSLGKRW